MQRGWSMRAFSMLLFSGMLLMCCRVAHADRIRGGDPEVIISGGKGSFPVDSSFSFVSPSGTSPIDLPGGSPCQVGTISVPDCIFENGTGSTWTSLTFTISPTGQIGPFDCSALAYFTDCLFNSTGTEVTFSGGSGIGAGDDFLIEVIAWLPNTQFKGKARLDAPRRPDATPEPATVGLLLAGLGTLLAKRRLWSPGSSRV